MIETAMKNVCCMIYKGTKKEEKEKKVVGNEPLNILFKILEAKGAFWRKRRKARIL